MPARIPKLEPEIQIKVIEVERDILASEWTKEDDKALKTLNGHPGYEALVKKFRLHRALLKSALESQRFETTGEFSATQAWCQALKWAISQVKLEVESKVQTPRSLYELEEEEFRKITSATKLVGTN